MANPIARCAALVLIACCASAESRRLLPLDQSSRDPKLVAYLTKFKAAVAKRSRDELVPLIAPEIKLGFGGEDGIANFQPDWPALDRLLYEIVEVEDQGDQWWQVKTINGQKGFVSAKFIASPIGYRAIFNKNRRGEWKLTVLLAGD